MSFSDFEYAGKRKQTRRERFLAEMEQVVPWSGLVALIEPHYPKAGDRRKPYPLLFNEGTFLCSAIHLSERALQLS
ncbi:IS5 family transposase [Pseudomonas baetica]|uniref:IS5 family transposase n=1 Tax=Pseudomonas baetica TaxID=674054 RepID=A0ABX4Q310_9PSED|nr:IS5 family transposase [Pseudomonas baetica]